ncbi:hypothetical protein MHU86_23177 [Fragilaria crotonensis]|nr:hypothetical protein MHU86_23177 [Fragilaria crotonensis]
MQWNGVVSDSFRVFIRHLTTDIIEFWSSVIGSGKGPTPTSFIKTKMQMPKPVGLRLHASSVKFDGSCEDLKGHIFDCADVKQSDIFVETTKAIAIYVGAKYKYGADTSTAVETLEEQIIEVPPPCADVENPTLKRIWEKKIDEYVKRTTYIEENNKTLYSLVWGQCTDIMQQKVRSSEGFDVTMKTKNGVGLLTAIKNIAFSFEGQKYHPLSLLEAKKRFLNQVQGRTVTTQAYYEKFRNTMNVLKAIGADIGLDSGMRKILNGDRDMSTMTSDERRQSTKKSLNASWPSRCSWELIARVTEDCWIILKTNSSQVTTTIPRP